MSYRSYPTRRVSFVNVPSNHRQERVMEVGERLRSLQLRRDLMTMGPPVPKIPSLVTPGPELPEDVMGLLLFYSAESLLGLKNINSEFNSKYVTKNDIIKKG